jgi:tripartite-type tricarboxylate transporter receptor subunit TctC
MGRHVAIKFLFGFILFGGSLASVRAQSVEQFYRTRTIDLIIGYDPGGGYDLYGRLISRYLGRYIPGQPNIVVQNMPGAGGLRAGNYLYSAAAKDGTALGLVTQTVALEKMLKTPNVQFDANRFNWIGRVQVDDDVLVTWHTSKVKTIADALTQEAVIPGPSSGIFMPPVLDRVIGTKFKVITGYIGSNDNLLNMERGEVDGATTSWSALKTSRPDWLKTKQVNFIVQFTQQRLHDLPDVPDMVEVAKTPGQQQVLSLYANGAAVGKSIFAPPEVPSDRVEALRSAFQSMLKDADFVADAQRLNLDITPLSGAELQRNIVAVTGAPAAIKEAAVSARGGE